MAQWACGIVGCGGSFEDAEALIRHQVDDHPPCECAVCGETVPAGYLAIRHAFEAHTRAEFVRAYDADSDDIRQREELLADVEEHVDVIRLVNQLGDASESTAVSGAD